MRAVPPELDERVVSEIDARLEGVAGEERVRIPWAIESGSRAWGFPSPDSDYDCRFLYLRTGGAYLTLWPERDVIETPLDEVFDVNGWDVAKALRLLVTGNATVIEWLRSPIVYRGDEGFRDRMLSLASEVVDRGRIGRHYLHVGRQQRAAGTTLKRFFYALRPAATLRWMADHPDESLPPMNLAELLAGSSAPEDVRHAARELVEVKSRTREMGDAPAPEILQRFVADEFERAAAFDTVDPAPREAARERADTFFREEIDRVD